MTYFKPVVGFIAACLLLAPVHGRADEFHHVHLRVADRPAALEWYAKHMEGQQTKVGDIAAVAFGKSHLLFLPAKDDTESNVGSTLDHIGFSFRDLEAKMAEFEEAGVKIVQPVRQIGSIKFGFIDDPWGTRIEVMEDRQLYGFHHIHLHTPDPQAMLGWFAEHLGGEPTRYFGILPAIRYGDVWILAQKVPAAKEPTISRSADHIGWLFDDLTAAVERFKAKGVTIDQEPEPFSGGRYAFITGPNGLRFELVELRGN